MSNRAVQPSMSSFSIAVYECLILAPAERLGSFRRIGYLRFTPNTDAKDADKKFKAIDDYFRSQTIPTHLYENWDGGFMYTFTLF